MARVDKVKPLDELLDDKIDEFESGEEKERDRDLDSMIWELGDYESQEPPEAAAEFQEERQIEEELAEKKVRGSKSGRATFIEPRFEEEKLSGGEKVEALQIGPGARRKGRK